jgi:hypothetical protein
MLKKLIFINIYFKNENFNFSIYDFYNNKTNFKVIYNLMLSCNDCMTVTGKLNLNNENLFRINSISVSLEGANRTTYLNDQKIFTL